MIKTIVKRYQYVKWLIKELIATCSDEPSYFSKKRIQSWILFDCGVLSMIIYFWHHYSTMTNFEILSFSGVFFAAAGYQLSTIQREKRFNQTKKTDNETN